MGNEGSEMTFLRPPYYRDSDQNFRVFEASLLWGKTEDRTAGKQSERDRVRERERERERYPSFQKRDAHALRFGSMNPITRLLVHGVFVANLLCGFGAGFRVFAASLPWGFGGGFSDF